MHQPTERAYVAAVGWAEDLLVPVHAQQQHHTAERGPETKLSQGKLQHWHRMPVKTAAAHRTVEGTAVLG